MKSKSFMLCSLLALSSPTMAGFYAGILGGGNAVNIERTLTYPLDFANPTVANFENSYANFHGQLFGGYKLNLPSQAGLSLQLDGDLFGGSADYRIHNWFFDQSAEASERIRYGASVFALYEQGLNPYVTVFAGPGYVYNEFATDYSATAGNIGLSLSQNQWLSGAGLKAGMAGRLSPSIELLLTWQYNQYERVTWTGVEPITGDTIQASYHPFANLFMVGLRFCAEAPLPMKTK